ncbi:hypothetical protein BKA67DRAFT_595091 [Truncatella angustata]|uniref:Uncharacterized protein n=1 Tax=Truncatella angustata TaxID=152316 RepID=A0A9P8UC38_9PEZI|nr:uncharacterized protein BKA67DRAFT_595091 [Truncatella angustata]KAH6646907.1 hypothetical protein BKA67DRAFT_595091 [Truncatella angustata]
MWFKLGPKGLGSDARVWTASCIDQNPGYDVQFLTDESAAGFVNESFAHRPDIVDTYNALTVPILKADLLRYLLLYAEGGVWFDLDASCEGIPIDDWIPPELEERADLVVGWEFDAGYRFQFRQFTTWAVLSRRGVSHLMAVVDDIVDAVHEAARAHNTTVSMLDKNMVGDVVDFTGPIRFAQSVMKSIDRSTNMAYKWDDYHGLLEPKLAGNILILPGYSFAASCNTYEPRDQHRIRPPLVEHHYAGTWKNDYGGERIE